MKHLLLIFTIIAMGLSGGRVSAADDTWGFLYEFHFTYLDGAFAVSTPYRISSGEIPVLPHGDWTLSIKDARGGEIRDYSFDPVSIEDGKNITILVPLESRGAMAEVRNPRGMLTTQIDISLSRVCNDDGICLADAGETTANCPTDCAGAVASSGVVDGSATIARQLSFGEQLGAYLFKISAAVSGIVLLFGVVQILDNRRRT